MLIVVSSLIEPPTEISTLRSLTLILKKNYDLPILLETEQEMKDLYWKYLQKWGAFDFFDDIIREDEEKNQIRLDQKDRYKLTVVTRAIVLENYLSLIQRISAQI